MKSFYIYSSIILVGGQADRVSANTVTSSVYSVAASSASNRHPLIVVDVCTALGRSDFTTAKLTKCSVLIRLSVKSQQKAQSFECGACCSVLGWNQMFAPSVGTGQARKIRAASAKRCGQG